MTRLSFAGGRASAGGRTSSGGRASPRHKRRRATVGTAFADGGNCFNFLRVALAMVVFVQHIWSAGGFGLTRFGRYEPGALAVDLFFVISGFLITYSRVRLPSTARYLWHRSLRILPAFWVCLAVVALVIAPLAWLHDHGSLDGYFGGAPHGPFRYIVANSTLKISFYDILGTPTGVPLSPPRIGPTAAWNGSLWSLWWEFVCYLGVAFLVLVGVIPRRRRMVVAIAAVLWAALVAHWLVPDASGVLGVLGSGLAGGVLRIGPLFLCGSLLYLYGDRIPLSGPLAGLCVVVIAAGGFLTEPHVLIDPPLAYLCLWLALRLPFRRVGSRVDLSYGLYIYTSPIQQLMAVYGVHRHGVVAYFSACLLLSVAVSVASWYAVEAPALRLKHATPGVAGLLRRRRASGQGASGQGAAVAVAVPRQRGPHGGGAWEPPSATPVKTANETDAASQMLE
ncbi:acyltransferase family protein [Parafrankia discariae]|uniref:acyltransferase family protein n=1 Tax=Parafrankia discariae TaxID=365528 RepID=UPI0003724C27|nr:acyltransferase [Parafrankia discariae]